MKKFLIPLLCLFPMSVFALDFVNDVSVSSEGVGISYDQDGNELRISYDGLSLYNADEIQVGLEYAISLPAWSSGFDVAATYEFTDVEDNVVGLSAGLDWSDIKLDTSLEWNINTSDFDAKVGTGYDLFGLDGSVTSKWDVDDFSYEGMDIDAGYTWNVSDTFSVRPSLTIPVDSDWGRGDLVAGVSISLSFGSTSTE